MYAQEYVANDLMDKSPVELIRLLYSKAIEKLQQAVGHTQEGNLRERGAALARVMEIVAELQGSLNLEEGGEVALELARLYDYAQSRLIEAASDTSSETEIEEVRAVLGNLCDGWNQCEPPPAEAQEQVPENFPAVGAAEEEASGVETECPEQELPAPLAPAEAGGPRETRVWTL